MDWDFRRCNNRSEFEPRRDETRRRAGLGPGRFLLLTALVALAVGFDLGIVVYVVAAFAGIVLWGLGHLALMALGLPLPGERNDD